MLKQTVTYEGFDGEKVTEDVYLNLTAAELAEMHFDYEDGFHDFLKKIMEEGDNKKLFAAFKELLARAYGRRSEDGKRFVKRPEWTQEFVSGEAYSAVFMQLATDPKKAADFFNQIVPKNLAEQVAKLKGVETDSEIKAVETEIPVWVRENRHPTKKELQAATPEELQAAWLAKAGK